MEKQIIKYGTNIDIIPSSIKKLNPQFSLCDVMVMYAGDNRNKTSISKDVVNSALYSLYGIPIVGEWLKDKNRFGDHGEKISITDEGINFEITTKPLGFVTKEAVETATWVKKKLPNGVDEKEWLYLKGCILWTDRYEEANHIVEEGTNQSMEISFEDAHYREDGYLVGDEIVFSALCAIGVEPCFEESNISRHYAFDEFKIDFQLMLDEYKKFSTSNDGEDVLKKMEVKYMEKVITALSALTFKCEEVDKKKYEILSVTEAEANVIDREDNYKVYSIPYSIAEDESVTFDYDAKVEKSLDVKEKSEEDFSIKTEIDSIADERVQRSISAYESGAVTELTEKYEALNKKYSQLEKDYSISQEKVNEFEMQKKEAEFELYKKEIDDLVESYSAKMETFADFLLYRSKIDYSKSKDQINTDLLILLGKANVGKKSSFSFNPVISGAKSNASFESENGDGRYGNLFDRIKK